MRVLLAALIACGVFLACYFGLHLGLGGSLAVEVGGYLLMLLGIARRQAR